MIQDAHDKRTFRHYEKRTADGTPTGAIVEVFAGEPPPTDHEGSIYVDVTDQTLEARKPKADA